MVRGKGRRSTINVDTDESLCPELDLKQTVRIRKMRLLKSLISAVSQLNDQSDGSRLRVLKDDLETHWVEFMRAFEEEEAVLVSIGHAELDAITAEYMTMHNSYVKAKVYVSGLLSDFVSINSQNTQQNAPAEAANNNNQPMFKLAPLRITPFAGNLAEWIEFKATCDVLLESTVKEVQRLTLLKEALYGEARSLVRHIVPGPGSFKLAMDLLVEQYDNQRAIINAHLKSLYEIPPIEKSTADAIRKILNTINGLIAALSSYKIVVSSWDAILIFHTSQRFDQHTLSLWEEKLDGMRTVPKLRTLLDFLLTRITVLETTETFATATHPERTQKNFSSPKLNNENKRSNEKGNERVKSYFTLKETFKCALCGKNHLPSRCLSLNNMSARDIQIKLKEHQLCENCFYPHPVVDCPFKPACRHCSEPHNSRLHSHSKQMFMTNATDREQERNNLSEPIAENDDDDALSAYSQRYFFHVNDESANEVILSTAILPVQSNKNSALLHTLIDDGSTANLITLNACRLLNLRFTPLNIPIVGVGNSPVGRVIGKAKVIIKSLCDESYVLPIKVIVVHSIGESKGVPKRSVQEWNHLAGLSLANPKFYNACKFDLLLGNAAHADFILDKIVRGERHQPIARQSKLGWLISGGTNTRQSSMSVYHTNKLEPNVQECCELSAQLKQFWELEEVSVQKIPTAEEQLAENVFVNSIQRTADGKFMVDLPFKMSPQEQLGKSFPMAMRRYMSLQRRFDKNPQLKQQYDAILEEYLTLNHMELVRDNPSFQCFLPHHAVMKESSSTTKVRTVFDASAKTSTGVALNDCLCVGPVIQPELFDLLIVWRRFEFAVSSDIEKMYRMMRVNPDHANWQTILWHRPGTSGILPYRLLTVTFGTSSAPFQATRGIYEIGERIKESQPELAKLIQSHFYVDDFLGSFATINEARDTSQTIISELAKYNFNLRKWKSNDARVLEGISEIDREQCIDFDSTFKTLGIAWHAHTDAFVFKPMQPKEADEWTKRKIFSVIAKLFDPIGWLAPCIVRAKLLMQEIWRLPNDLGWDSALPPHIVSKWQLIYSDLVAENEITIPRWLKLSTLADRAELHVFCDASALSYACCVYLRVIHNNNTVSCNLVAAKSKVAPIRIVTIPRLELCGAVLAAKLVTRCVQTLSMDNVSITAWCDSKIVLAWLATHPSRWSVFVSHRTSEIHDKIDATHWKHIPTKQNPADIASRGSTTTDIKNSCMWWHGPKFLTTTSEKSPTQPIALPVESAPEKRKEQKTFHLHLPKENYVLEKFENLTRLLHFTCLAFRWLHKTRRMSIVKGPVSAEEMDAAEIHWIRCIQTQNFGHEISQLKANRSLSKNSMLLKLTPFIDGENILRMNGRVTNAELIHQKTSIILPSKSRFVLLVIRNYHEQQAKHGGVQLTLRAIRNRYWIIHARNQVNKVISRCITCYRNKKLLINQQMAELPPCRTTPALPFTFTGCDFAGPFQVKTNENRNAPTTKGYVALFICLTTKAVHFEIVADLSTAEYVMAFENFIATRRIPSVMYTDNGTNLVGGEREIQMLHDQYMRETNALTRLLAANRIRFKRIPARASHMGGIWERAVGLMKYHLHRILKDTKLTTRRYHHALKQIECSLNSRPLWAVTPNADDMEVLTPSHFLNFEASNTLPRPDITHIKMNRLDHYQYLHRLYQDFWKGWSKEYVDQLQSRQKWQEKKPNIQIGSIVVISEDNLPPCKWSLGRVVATYPDKQGIVRVVDVKCGESILKRPIHRLGLLPIIENERLTSSVPEQLNGGENVEEFSTII